MKNSLKFIKITKKNNFSSSIINHQRLPKIFYFGNDDISLTPLQRLNESLKQKSNNSLDKTEIEVVTTPITKGCKQQLNFHSYIKNNNINSIYIKDNNFTPVIERLSQIKGSFIGFILSFGKMIPDEIIDKFSESEGLFVLHPSLLPKYRGGAPIQHALLNEEKETGVSLIHTSKGKFDSGGIVLQSKILIKPNHTFEILSSELSNECYELIERYFNGERGSAISSEKGKFAKIITDRNFVYLDFKNKTSRELKVLYNSFYGSQLTPWCFFEYNGKTKQVIFEDLSVINSTINTGDIGFTVRPGDVIWDFSKSNALLIRALDNWMITTKIKMEGFDTMDANKFIGKCIRLKKTTNGIANVTIPTKQLPQSTATQ